MPTHPTDDQDLDVMELADAEEATEEVVAEEEHPAEVHEEEEVIKDIEKVGVEEDAPVKNKAHMIPSDLITRSLTIDDLFDEGQI